jgi:hypothetical protein
MRTRALLFAATALACLLAGRLSSGCSSSPPPSPSPTREAAGVALGYPHSRAGATLAAAGYQQAFADPAVLKPAVLRARIEAIATPEFAPKMIAANSPGARRLAAGLIGEGVRRGVQTVFFTVPVGYRLLSYSPSRARVLTWGFTVLGNAAGAEPTAYFGTGRTELRWLGGDWKIAYTRSAFGPSPAIATPARGGDRLQLLDLASQLEPYEIAR